MVFKSSRLNKLFVVFLSITAIYLVVIFVSYLYTWQLDENLSDYSFWALLVEADLHVNNLGGKIGFTISNLFVKNMFGVSAFVLPLILAFIVLNTLTTINLELLKFSKIYLLFAIFMSLVIGMFESEFSLIYAGCHGKYIADFLKAGFGSFGAWFLILFYLVSIVAYLFEDFTRKIYYHLLMKINPKLVEAKLNPQVQNEEEGSNINPEQAFNEFEVQEEEIVEELEEKTQEQDELVLVEEFAASEGQLSVVEEKITKAELEKRNQIKEEPKQEEEFEILEEIKPKKKEATGDLELEVTELKQEEEIEIEESIPDIIVEDDEEEEVIDLDENNSVDLSEPYDPKKDLSTFENPSVSLLNDYNSGEANVDSEELKSNQNRIVETFSYYGIKIVKIKATIGPTITLYEIVPENGTRISKIKNLEDDIAMSLAAEGIRIIAPMPGKGTVGIEVANEHPDIVSMRSILVSKKFQESKYDLPVAIGKTIDNETFTFDLAKAPHLLMAGATGQGKSVGLNAIIASLLYKKHPAELKFVMIDPKKVELSLYEVIQKHYLAKEPNTDEIIINDTKKVINTLNSLCVEMDKRYDLLKEVRAKNIKEYNAKFINRQLNPMKGHKFMPYIVVVIDEFADLIMTAGKEIEMPIARIAQLARAVGIHMIIATQRPSTNIITGTIKANFPTRIAFKVSSSVDSRTILDSPGANKLIGRGDMLYSFGTDKVRLQCAFIDTPELEDVLEYIGKQQSYPSVYLLPEFIPEGGDEEEKDVDLSRRDAKFEEAARLIVMHQQGSTSLIQRKLEVGYNRAGRIIDQLEAAEIVGPFKGSKAREVLVLDEMQLEQVLNSLP